MITKPTEPQDVAGSTQGIEPSLASFQTAHGESVIPNSAVQGTPNPQNPTL